MLQTKRREASRSFHKAFLAGREVEFVKLCSAALDGFGVDCEWVQADDNGDIDLDLLGTRDGAKFANLYIHKLSDRA